MNSYIITCWNTRPNGILFNYNQMTLALFNLLLNGDVVHGLELEYFVECCDQSECNT